MAESSVPKISLLAELYRNISQTLVAMERAQRVKDKEQESVNEELKDDDNGNAWMYILFVLMFYAFSIVVLMVKYIRREREGAKLEYYYNEFVKRDWYRDKNMYDVRGRRIRYRVEEGGRVTKVGADDEDDDEDDAGAKRRRRRRRRKSYYEDPDEIMYDSYDEYGSEPEEEEYSNG